MASVRSTFARSMLTLLAGVAIHGGVVLAQPAEGGDKFRGQAQQLMTGPSGGPPTGNITSLAQPLRCMDGLFRTFGARGVSVLIEDIPDATSKVKVGAKDMFVSATSQMTRGSRAVRLIPWVNDGAIFRKKGDEVLSNANFAVQGSISQFDESMLRKQRDGAICLGPLCIGGAESDSYSGMSLDLNMIETEGLTLIPGVTAKNVVLVRRKGKGFDGDISMKKFGVQYNFTLTSSDAQGQALRTLVELSVIELYGRLLKIPYWSCLGLTDADPGVASEIDDWWETLRGDIPSLVSYFQIQMQARGLYKGEIDGQLGEEIRRAIRSYRTAMGFPDDLNLDVSFFRQYLAADHARLQPVAAEKLAEINGREGTPVAAPSPAPAAAPAPEVTIVSRKGNAYVHRRGEPVELEVRPSGDGFLYCYFLDHDRKVTQFFPNRVQPSAAVRAGTAIQFPGSFGFSLLASRKGLPETIACFSSAQDLGSDALGNPVGARDVAALRDSFMNRAGSETRMGVFDVKVQ